MVIALRLERGTGKELKQKIKWSDTDFEKQLWVTLNLTVLEMHTHSHTPSCDQFC